MSSKSGGLSNGCWTHIRVKFPSDRRWIGGDLGTLLQLVRGLLLNSHPHPDISGEFSASFEPLKLANGCPSPDHLIVAWGVRPQSVRLALGPICHIPLKIYPWCIHLLLELTELLCVSLIFPFPFLHTPWMRLRQPREWGREERISRTDMMEGRQEYRHIFGRSSIQIVNGPLICL